MRAVWTPDPVGSGRTGVRCARPHPDPGRVRSPGALVSQRTRWQGSVCSRPYLRRRRAWGPADTPQSWRAGSRAAGAGRGVQRQEAESGLAAALRLLGRSGLPVWGVRPGSARDDEAGRSPRGPAVGTRGLVLCALPSPGFWTVSPRLVTARASPRTRSPRRRAPGALRWVGQGAGICALLGSEARVSPFPTSFSGIFNSPAAGQAGLT